MLDARRGAGERPWGVLRSGHGAQVLRVVGGRSFRRGDGRDPPRDGLGFSMLRAWSPARRYREDPRRGRTDPTPSGRNEVVMGRYKSNGDVASGSFFVASPQRMPQDVCVGFAPLPTPRSDGRIMRMLGWSGRDAVAVDRQRTRGRHGIDDGNCCQRTYWHSRGPHPARNVQGTFIGDGSRHGEAINIRCARARIHGGDIQQSSAGLMTA